MADRKTHFTEQGAALDDAFAQLATKDDLAAMEARFDAKTEAILQAVQNLGGRVEEMSKQLAAMRR